MTLVKLSAANPLFGLPLQNRADMVDALRRLIAPLEPWRSEGNARVILAPAGAVFDQTASELEGFARPLWGAVPAALGGDDVLDWAQVRNGLTNGTDPEHPEFWGWPKDIDQRLVELAAIGFAMLAVPDRIWEPLPKPAQANVITYLRAATACKFSPNNWYYFRLLMDAGMRAVGEDIPVDAGQFERDEIEALYLGNGWYRDGPGRRVDYYTGFAFHTYALILHRFAAQTDKGDHLARARLFAPQFANWFDQEGRSLPYGRSMTYRFASTSFFGAYALADENPVLDWGVLKGIVLRNLRWWATQSIADRDGVLPVGYAYPNPMMAENYNSPGSPYWALKAFLPLALPADHPFWVAEEKSLPEPTAKTSIQPEPGFLIQHLPDQTVALCAGQESQNFRHGAEKYAKFSYSTRFPFSVEARGATLMTAALDGMLGVQAEGREWTPRRGCVSAAISEGMVHAVWHPYEDVSVETWLMPHFDGHLRLHRVTTPVPLATVEGGFAIARSETDADIETISDDQALIRTNAESEMRDLSASLRKPRVHSPDPNTNLGFPRTWVPQLIGKIDPGTTKIACFCRAGNVSSPVVFDQEEARRVLLGLDKHPADLRPVGAMTGTADV